MHFNEKGSSRMSTKEIVRRNFLLFYVNGEEIIERNAQPEWTLLFYLRNSKIDLLLLFQWVNCLSRIASVWFEIGLWGRWLWFVYSSSLSLVEGRI